MMFEKIARMSDLLTADSANLLRELIAIPSTSGNEGAVIERIANAMSDNGFDEVYTDPMGNLLGRIGSGKHVLAMDGHVDTVDIGNINAWQFDPFQGKQKNGIIYGRGASDMKGALAALVYAGKIIKQLDLEDDFTLYVTATIQEEECDGLCWQYIVKEDKIVPESVIICEPTNLQLYRGQRGRVEFEIITEGFSSHGATPERGDNAIYKITPIIHDIEKLNHTFKSESFLGKGSITISRIRSEAPSLNAVADLAAIYIDRRLTTGETIESALREISALSSIQNVKAKIIIPEYESPSYKGLTLKMQKYYPAWSLEQDNPALKCASELYKKIYLRDALPGKWDFSTNGVATAGLFKIPTFGFGPANEIHAHTVNDQCPIWHLTEAMKFYAAFPKYYVMMNASKI